MLKDRRANGEKVRSAGMSYRVGELSARVVDVAATQFSFRDVEVFTRFTSRAFSPS